MNDNRLTRLPGSLAKLEHLGSLLFRGNQIRQLPEWLADMASLRMLNCGHNQLTHMPDWIGRLTGLIELHIGSTPLEHAEWLQNLRSLQVLDIRDAALTHLSECLAAFRDLVRLDVSGNLLTTLPDWLGELTQLEYLFVGGNEIRQLPDALRSLTSLVDLDLEGLRLGTLPDWISNLTELVYLNLDRNELSEVPEGIRGLTKLRYLILDNNPLGTLPPWIGELDQLASLDLWQCHLTELPESARDLTELAALDLTGNRLEQLPDYLGRFAGLEYLRLARNPLMTLPESLGELEALTHLDLSLTGLTELPPQISTLSRLTRLNASGNQLTELPGWLRQLSRLETLVVADNELSALPFWLADLPLKMLDVEGNPLPPELLAASEDSVEELLGFLGLLRDEGALLHEAKLVLVGEGAVGKSSLLSALRGEEFVDGRDTTHGIEVKQLWLDPILLNAWDFGGQPIYRPTHQLFFSSPAVYLVVWKPREGPEQGFVDYWIKLIQHRAGDSARIHVVATHGGPLERSAYLDEAALRERYGDMIAGFHHVDSRSGLGLDELRQAIESTAWTLPHIGRWYPQSWQRFREVLREHPEPYLTYARFEAMALEHGLTATSAKSLAKNSHALGHWIHYTDDPALADLVILKADWLATAISLVLDDRATIDANGLLRHRSLRRIWNDPRQKRALRYPEMVHRVFLQLMERFDISYRVKDGSDREEPTSLVAQLVRSDRPDLTAWTTYGEGLEERTQVCEIVEAGSGVPAMPEGLMYQLIVRFHRYSLGRDDYRHSVHWQHGVVLDADHHGRALITLERNRFHVTVRAAYPQLLLHQITEDLREHVQSYWKGLTATVKVSCGRECGRTGLFDVEKLVSSRQKGRSEYPCATCDEWKDIDQLLLGVRPANVDDRLSEAIKAAVRPELAQTLAAIEGRFDRLDVRIQRAIGQAEERYQDLLAAFDDEAREGPRLFTVEVVDSTFTRPGWIKQRIRLTLWCEHSRVPLHVLGDPDSQLGVYDIDVPREWVVKAGPWLKAVSIAVRTLLPVSLAGLKLDLSETQWTVLGERIELAEKALGAVGGVADVLNPGDEAMVRPEASLVRTVHALLKERDPSFAGLERVRDRSRYRWVHPRFTTVYRLPAPEIPGSPQD